MKPLLFLVMLMSLVVSCTEDDLAQPDLTNHQTTSTTDPTERVALAGLETPSAGIRLAVKVFLSGPYIGGSTMSNTLNKMGLLPLAQPYGGLPYQYAGKESVSGFDSEIVDWILLRLIDPVTLAVFSERAALLKASGEVVDIDGVSPVTFKAEPDLYLISVHHRNHLDILSEVVLDLRSGSGSLDFTKDNSGSIEIGSGIYAMIKGDINGDQLVKYNGSSNDKNTVLTTVGIRTPNAVLSSYHAADVNMDGYVKYNGSQNDKQAILEAVGLTSPNRIVVGQLY